jgi:hypothetical protein
LHGIGRCFDYREKTFRNSESVKKLSDDDSHDGSTFFVLALANQEKPLHGTQLKEMMAAASHNQVTRASWKICSSY